MAGGTQSPAGSRPEPVLAAFAPGHREALFADFAAVLTCENGHTFPANAGACPYDPPPPPRARRPAAARAARDPESVPAVAQALIDQFVVFVDNGQAPRSNHAYGWESAKLGVVNHIPVCDTLAQLTAYFNGGNAAGSTHFGIGREHAGDLEWEGRRVPCAPVHQYMPIVGAVAPWAQGAIQTSSNCSIRPSPTIRGMRSGEPNGAFVSIENVARQGSDGVTEAQFNANVLLRAYCAAYFGHEITPLTQLWHAEIDQACVTPETRILTRDLRWIPAGDLAVGDRIIGFDDAPTIGRNNRDRGRRAWRDAEVVASGTEPRCVYRITTDKGTTLDATAEHRWLVRRGVAPSGVIDWVRTDELAARQHHNRFGSYLPRFFQPWDERTDYAAGYLAAAFDGEGSLLATGRRAPVMSFSQRENAMLIRVTDYLNWTSIGYHVQVCDRALVHPNWSRMSVVRINGSLQNVVRLLGETRPPRLLDVWKGVRLDGLMMRAPQEWDERIVSVEKVGEREIVMLTSSSGTYVAEGFGAHNTRCFDPGWDGALEDAMQEAARQVLRGDISGLRGVSAAEPAPNGGGGGGTTPTLEQVQLGLISKVLAQDWRALRDDAAKLAGDA